MKKIKRLTYRGTPQMTEDGMITPTYSDYPVRQLIEKLAEYEDAEENNRMILLPLAVGEHVMDKARQEYIVSKHVCYSWLSGVIEYEANHITDDILIRFKSTDIGKTIFTKDDVLNL